MIKQGRHNVGYLIDCFSEGSISINKYFYNKKQALRYWRRLLSKLKVSHYSTSNLSKENNQVTKSTYTQNSFGTFHKISRKRGIKYSTLLDEF